MVAIIPSLLKTRHREKNDKIIGNGVHKCRSDAKLEWVRI